MINPLLIATNGYNKLTALAVSVDGYIRGFIDGLITDTHDGGYYLTAVEYRKHLENIVKITDERMFKKNIKKVIKKLRKAPIAIQEIIQPKIKVIEAQPDFSFVDGMAQDLLAAIAELNLYIQKIERERQEEEEFLFILECSI